jgi:hypothetical protein
MFNMVLSDNHPILVVSVSAADCVTLWGWFPMDKSTDATQA